MNSGFIIIKATGQQKTPVGNMDIVVWLYCFFNTATAHTFGYRFLNSYDDNLKT